MGRKSTLRRLPPEIQTEINRILSEGRLTLDELLEHLRGIGVEGVSRSALGRQKQKIDKVAAKLRQSREIVETLVEKTGPSTAEGKQGRLLVEILRKLVYDHLEKNLLGGEEDGPDNEGFFFLAKALKEMSQAARLEQDFEAKIHDRIQKETIKAVETSAREAGLSAETVEAIKSRILGVKDA
ncbi:MAG: DUF3486 family protein [Desulfovibrionaceae bacterium]